jgi:hypothetical protein
MPSPFPGMNPYLEQASVWTDFHDRLVPRIADALAAQVDPNYIVTLQEHLYVHEAGDERRLVGRADVGVVPGAGSARPRTSTATAEATTIVELPVKDVERISSVEIRDRSDRQLVTVIEVLRPANKYSGSNRKVYEHKRDALLAGLAHLVEIDLLRGGPRMPAVGMPRCDYCILISRAEDRPEEEVWSIRLRDPLPAIPVPLRSPDPDARLDLQQLLHQVYDAARYQSHIYQGKPAPRLSREDATWAAKLLKAALPSAPGKTNP